MPSDHTKIAKFDRRLAAVAAVDVVAYSRHMHLDEEWTHARYKADRSEVIDPSIARHKGRIVKPTGDRFLAEFQVPSRRRGAWWRYRRRWPHATYISHLTSGWSSGLASTGL